MTLKLRSQHQILKQLKCYPNRAFTLGHHTFFFTFLYFEGFWQLLVKYMYIFIFSFSHFFQLFRKLRPQWPNVFHQWLSKFGYGNHEQSRMYQHLVTSTQFLRSEWDFKCVKVLLFSFWWIFSTKNLRNYIGKKPFQFFLKLLCQEAQTYL